MKIRKLAPIIILLFVILILGVYFLAPNFFTLNKSKPTPPAPESITISLEKKIYIGQIKTLNEKSLTLIDSETGQGLSFEIGVNTKFNQKTGLKETETEGVYKKITKEVGWQDFKTGDQVLMQAVKNNFDGELFAELVQLTD